MPSMRNTRTGFVSRFYETMTRKGRECLVIVVRDINSRTDPGQKFFVFDESIRRALRQEGPGARIELSHCPDRNIVFSLKVVGHVHIQGMLSPETWRARIDATATS